jgi:hypothetical protein
MFWIGSVGAFVMVVSIIAGLPFGVEGVAYALVIANIIMLYPNFRYAWIQIDLDLKEGFSEIFPVLVISVFMCMGVLSLDYFVTKYIDNQLVRLTVMIGSGILIYVVLLRLRYKNIMLLVKELKK